MFGLFITNVVALLVGAIIVFKLINIATRKKDDKENY
jgi:large-conductance mechanosensitive channel